MHSLPGGSCLISECVYLSVHTAGLGWTGLDRTRLGQAGGGDSDIPVLGGVSSPSQLLGLGVYSGRGVGSQLGPVRRPTPSSGAPGQPGRKPEGGATEGGTWEGSC